MAIAIPCLETGTSFITASVAVGRKDVRPIAIDKSDKIVSDKPYLHMLEMQRVKQPNPRQSKLILSPVWVLLLLNHFPIGH
tara:strand:+ start:130 stop:372 length:243 start_codon:yes stop_codon:yes gene_type:complete